MPSQKLQQKFKRVPSIFKQFDQIPKDWVRCTLEKLSDDKKGSIKMGPFGSSLKKHELLDEGEVKTLWIENVVKNKLDLMYKKFISKKKYKELEGFTVKPNDVLLTMMGTLGRIAIIPEDIGTAIISSHLLKITLDSKKCIPEFLYYFLLSNFVLRQLLRESRGIVMEGLNTQIIKSLLINQPSIPEQQKIASILSNVDDSIQKTTEQIEKTKQLKTGFMQKLLTKGIGHTKFKETIFGPRFLRIQIPKDWDCDLLENHSDVHVGHVGPTSEYYCDDGVVFLRTQNVRENMPDLADVLHITRQFHLEHKKSQLLPKDILVSRVGNSGIACVIPNDFPEANCANVLILRKKESLDAKFFCYFLNSHIAQLEITSREAGGVQLVLNAKTLEKLSIPILPLKEQQKIASILSNVDSQTESLQSKKSQLQKTKRGLMQKLLTGQIRVRV